jgi:Skp family chaperone for outer membrane proteins
MVLTPRGILAIGLSLAGIAYVVAPSRIQAQQPQKADGGVRAAATGNGTGNAAVGPPAPVPPVIGTVDLSTVLTNYDKMTDMKKDLSAAVKVKQGELMKLESEYRSKGEMLQKFQPGSSDFKKIEDGMTELKARMEALREQAEREFSLRQAEILATIYKEVQGMVASVAKWRKINYVLKVSTKPPSATDPNTVMAALNEALLYSDPRNDITNDVVHYLNRWYKTTKSPEATTKPAARPAQAGAAQP